MSDLYILDGQTPVKTDDVRAWGRWLEDTEQRRVGKDAIAGIEISTVFLGMDHNYLRGEAPILYETMIFAPPGDVLDGKQWRYRTWDEAEEGHRYTVRRVQRLARMRAAHQTRPRMAAREQVNDAP